jgi:hypothetical protein
MNTNNISGNINPVLGYNKIPAIIGFLAILFAGVTAQAQVPTYGAQTLWTTNGAGIPSATAVSTSSVMDVRKQASVAVQVTAQSDTSGAAIGLLLLPSVDGISYPTTGYYFTFTPGQTSTTVVTNFNTYGAGYMKLSYITNATGAACTNIAVKYGVKISAP